MKNSIAVVIPNWDGADMIVDTLDSLRKQSQEHTVIVVDNGSKDGSLALLRPLAKKGEIILIEHKENLGFTGGVNAGMRYAMGHGFKAVALLNNDAVAHKDWLKYLTERLFSDKKAGVVTCKILSHDGKTFDSTGDWLSTWGLPYPRGRGEPNGSLYDSQTHILGASGGATIFRCSMLKKVGVFDQDFFAYYEDVDLSLRIRLAGWEIYFEPRAEVYHRISATGSRTKGFTTYQTMKNLPWVLIKNLPFSLFVRIYPRFLIAYWAFVASAIVKGNGWWALKGVFVTAALTPKKLWQRWQIQRSRTITAASLDALLLHDLPPNATKLRKLRTVAWRLAGK